MTIKTYTKQEYNSNSGMLTSVWGPSLWHFLHTVSFNYPVNPTKKDKDILTITLPFSCRGRGYIVSFIHIILIQQG